MSAVVIDGAVVHYETWGRGPPLLLVHGWLGSWRYWMNTMEALSSDFRAYALDLWGFGDSAKDKSRYSITSYARLLQDFMEHMGMDGAAFVGHSVGGAVAMVLAARHPELVHRLVSVSVPVRANAISGKLRSFSNTLASQVVLKQDPGWVKRLLALAKVNHETVASETLKTDPEAISESMRSLASLDLAGELRRVQCPQLAILGRNDPLIDPAEALLFDALGERSRSITMEQPGHFPMLEEAPAFHRLLRDFLLDAEHLEDLRVKEMWHRRIR